MRFAVVVIVALLGASIVDAGCYKDKPSERELRRIKSHNEKYSGQTAIPSPTQSLDQLPKNFDWCNVNGKSFCTGNWNQHIPVYCGSCWVHGSLSTVNDRIKVLNNGEGVDVMLARQVLLNCGNEMGGFGHGCHGGSPQDVFEFMHRYGLPDETCQNYVAQEQPCDPERMCQNCMPVDGVHKCWAVKPYIKYYVREYGTVSGEEAIISELMARGPVVCGLAVSDDFAYNYRGGIYVDKLNTTEVDHDVEIVGFGEEETVTESGERQVVKYWNVRNSWGSYWGENGFFRLVRGVNMLRIEEECAFPIVDNSEQREFLKGKLAGSMDGIVPGRFTPGVSTTDGQTSTSTLHAVSEQPVISSPSSSTGAGVAVFSMVMGLTAVGLVGGAIHWAMKKRREQAYDVIPA